MLFLWKLLIIIFPYFEHNGVEYFEILRDLTQFRCVSWDIRWLQELLAESSFLRKNKMREFKNGFWIKMLWICFVFQNLLNKKVRDFLTFFKSKVFQKEFQAYIHSMIKTRETYYYLRVILFEVR